MPLRIPSLDDRTFEQLVAEGRSLIPRYTPLWTNHNPSDPGITLLELFAFLTETAIFQLDQVPAATLDAFLRLVEDGSDDRVATLEERTVSALSALATPVRAVTDADFERLVREAGGRQATPIARTAFRTHRDAACASTDRPDEAPVAAVVIVVPDRQDDPAPAPDEALVAAIFSDLTRHRLIATCLHVVGPTYVEVGLEATVVRRPGSGLSGATLDRLISDFLHPLRGWFDGTGWPFGRDVYFSELFQLLEQHPQVDHVEDLILTGVGGAVVPPELGGRAVPENGLIRVGRVATTVRDPESG